MGKQTTKIPPLRLDLEYEEIEKEIVTEVEKILKSGHYVLGPNVEAFEKEFAAWNGSRFSCGVASGTDALLLSLMALGIGEGDEVITTSWSFFATAGSIVRVGARPVFVDIDPKTYNINPALISSKITKKTKAILPVHIYGYPANMKEILSIAKNHKLHVIEDCAQAHGSSIEGKKVGTFGEFGCFSFYPTKNLGAYGDGGIITMDSDALRYEVAGLHVHGAWKKYFSEKVGINSRLDELQAAILRIKLRRLDGWIKKRVALAERYSKQLKKAELSDITPPYTESGYRHTYHQYALRVSRRDELLSHLKEKGIAVGIYYPQPLHLQQALDFLGYKEGDLPETECAAKETLTLPIFPQLTHEDQNYIVQSIREFYAR